MTIFAQADLPAATNTLVFTSADALGDTVNIMLCNRNANTTVPVTVYLVPSGTSSPSPQHAIEFNNPIDPTQPLERTGIMLGVGDQIFVNPAATGVSVTIQGAKI